MKGALSVLDTLRVRDLAHQLWENEGRPNGHALTHWLEAERMVKEGEARPAKPKREKRKEDVKKKKKKD
jgi:hypothetical protein